MGEGLDPEIIDSLDLWGRVTETFFPNGVRFPS